MKDRIVAAFGIIVVGVAAVALGIALLDVTIDRRFVGAFVLIPIGAVLIAACLWALVVAHVSGRDG
jgi:ABC-type uncharacterized transport system permease subunit